MMRGYSFFVAFLLRLRKEDGVASVIYVETNEPLVFKKIKELNHLFFVFHMCSFEDTVLFL